MYTRKVILCFDQQSRTIYSNCWWISMGDLLTNSLCNIILVFRERTMYFDFIIYAGQTVYKLTYSVTKITFLIDLQKLLKYNRKIQALVLNFNAQPLLKNWFMYENSLLINWRSTKRNRVWVHRFSTILGCFAYIHWLAIQMLNE